MGGSRGGGVGVVVARLGSYACSGRRRSVVSMIRVGGGMGRKSEKEENQIWFLPFFFLFCIDTCFLSPYFFLNFLFCIGV